MGISLKDLDKRICDCEESSYKEQTYRAYIEECEDKFEIEHSNIDLMEEEELKEYLRFMEDLSQTNNI